MPLIAIILLTLTLASPALSATPKVQQLAFVSPQTGIPQIFLIGADGTGLRKMTSSPDPSTTPAWSPDGSQLAFVRHADEGSHIYVIGADGSHERRLTATPGRHTSPSWSPDDRFIVFVSARGGPAQLMVMRRDGGAPRALTHAPGTHRAPAWSPDSGLIAYLSREDGGVFELHVMRPNGSQKQRVPTRAPGLQPDVTSFAWLPDGRLAYTSRTGPAQEGLTITTVDGMQQRFLGTGGAPAWAPDGRRFAFVVSRVGGAQIYARETAGGPPVRLTDPRLISVRPAWSPDGRQIAFLVIQRGVVTLTVMNADGSAARALAEVYGDLSAPPVFAWRPS